MLHRLNLHFQRILRWCVISVGRLISARHLMSLQRLNDYVRLGAWLAAGGYQYNLFNRIRDRTEVFNAVANEVADRKVLYLEFGVYRGASMRYWSAALRNAESRLHGFDSFEGLPEVWDGYYEKGHFNVDGQIPHIDDARVQFFKGWFNDTLPTYAPPAHDVLVINCDADLYSSTIYLLQTLAPYIVPGTYIYFDEFNSAQLQELRAFDEFVVASKRRFEIVSHNESLGAVFFRCLA